MRDYKEFSSKSIKEHHERVKPCFGEPLKNGEKRIICTPAYSIRKDPDNGSDYGNHCVDLVFVERRGGLIIDVCFYTGMYLTSPSEPMCTGLGYHRSKRKDKEEFKHESGECYYLRGKCFSNMGSSLYGDVIMSRLMCEGSAGVWDEIDKAFKYELSPTNPSDNLEEE